MVTKSPVTLTGSAPVRSIGARWILPLPQAASDQLPSRGQVAVTGELDGHQIQTVLEPDGRMGHWISLDAALPDTSQLRETEVLTFTFTTASTWPEPDVPEDLSAALEAAPDLAQTWESITPMARWEWVRWVGSTRNPDTRARRVEVSIDKLRNGSRRPCCFNLASCTDPEVARSGKLIGAE